MTVIITIVFSHKFLADTSNNDSANRVYNQSHNVLSVFINKA